MRTLLNAISLIVLIVGGLNWLAVGVAQYDVVANLFGAQDATSARAIYIIVGVAALYQLLPLVRILTGRS